MRKYKGLCYSDDFKILYEPKSGIKEFEEIEFHPHLTTIKSFAFADCTIKNIKFPNRYIGLNHSAFFRCNIENMNYPECFGNINETSFEDTKIKNLYFENESCKYIYLSNIEIENLYFSEKIDFITMPPGYNIKNYHVDKKNKVFYAQNGDLYHNSTLVLKGKNNSEILPIKTIGKAAFYRYNDALKTINLPKTVKEIKSSAFSNATLKEIIFPKYLEKIEKDVFYNTKTIKPLEFPKFLKEVSLEFLDGFNGSFSIAKDDNFFTIEDYVIYDKNKSIIFHYPKTNKNTVFVVPNTVKNLKPYLFENKYLKKISFEEGDELVTISSQAIHASNITEICSNRPCHFESAAAISVRKATFYKDVYFASDTFNPFFELNITKEAKENFYKSCGHKLIKALDINIIESLDEIIEKSANFKEINNKVDKIKKDIYDEPEL